MKNKALRILIMTFVLTAFAAGCGKKTESTVPADSVITESDITASKAEESVPTGNVAATTPEPQKLLNTANAAGQSDESLPEYLQIQETPDVFVFEDPDHVYAEGYLVAPGSKVDAASSAVEGTVGTPVSVTTPKGIFAGIGCCSTVWRYTVMSGACSISARRRRCESWNKRMRRRKRQNVNLFIFWPFL